MKWRLYEGDLLLLQLELNVFIGYHVIGGNMKIYFVIQQVLFVYVEVFCTILFQSIRF